MPLVAHSLTHSLALRSSLRSIHASNLAEAVVYRGVIMEELVGCSRQQRSVPNNNDMHNVVDVVPRRCSRRWFTKAAWDAAKVAKSRQQFLWLILLISPPSSSSLMYRLIWIRSSSRIDVRADDADLLFFVNDWWSSLSMSPALLLLFFINWSPCAIAIVAVVSTVWSRLWLLWLGLQLQLLLPHSPASSSPSLLRMVANVAA